MSVELMVSEIFGPTIQGEGRNLGLPCMFIRLQYCPVGCSFCDTKYTWKEGPKRDLASIVSEMREKAGLVRHVVISGGEPFAQPDVAKLAFSLVTEGWSIEFETSGTFKPPNDMPVGPVKFTVSPKPPSAKTLLPYDDQAIEWFLDNGAVFKFVISDPTDFEWAKELIKKYAIPHNWVYFMPEGITHEQTRERLAWLWTEVPKQMPRARITPRMHVDVFGAKRGV